MKKFSQYVRQNTTYYPPYVARKFDVPVETILDWTIELWHSFRNPHVVDNMICTDYPEGKWYYEVCDTPYKRGNYRSAENIQGYWLGNRTENQHISVFGHDQSWANNTDDSESVSCSDTKLYCPLFWVEMDRKDYKKRPNLQKALEDGVTLKLRIEILSAEDNVAWCFTSGNNSSHVAINGSLFGNPVVSQSRSDVFLRLAQRLARGLRFEGGGNPTKLTDEDLKQALIKAYPQMQPQSGGDLGFDFTEHGWRQTACAALENVDPNIYRTNSLIRQPWSLHEKTRNAKKLVDHEKPTVLNIKQHRPLLLKEYFQSWERPEKPKKDIAVSYSNDYIESKLLEIYPEINEYSPNEKGWVGPFYSALYPKQDSNPSVYINVNTGRYFDFGYSQHNFSLSTLIHKLRKK